MTVVYWLNWWDGHHPQAMWDQTLLQDTLARFPVTHDTEYHRGDSDPHPHDEAGAVVVIPGAYAHHDVARINRFLARLPRVLVIVTSDEESRFPHEDLNHPDMRVWLQYGRPDRGPVDRWLPIGYTPGSREILAGLDGDHPHAWVFDGQVNHERRVAMKAATAGLTGALAREANLWTATHGFAQGHDRDTYLRRLTSAKVALCPSGPCSPDSFRCWEALEGGTLPLAGAMSPELHEPGFWTRLCNGDPPFPLIHDWPHLAGHLTDALALWPRNVNAAVAWWLQEKRRLHWAVADTLTWLAGAPFTDGPPITVLVSTSPVQSNPSTAIIETTMASVRERLPDAPIVLMVDGVRPEQAHRRADYTEFTRRVLHLANHRWDLVYPIISDEWLHQACMTRRALDVVRSPAVLFMEHDAPLEGDIPFGEVVAPILKGNLDVLRFHFESEILRVHRGLMLDQAPVNIDGVPLQRTWQWSQRPHLASTAYYRERLGAYFGDDARCFIEDVLHGVTERGFLDDQRYGWFRNRVAIYTPPGNIRRSHHIDGRGAEEKGRQRFAYPGAATPPGAPAPRWVDGS